MARQRAASATPKNLPQSFGLDNRLQRYQYQGTRPIAFYCRDREYLLDVLSRALDDRNQYPSRQSKTYLALKTVHDRFKQEYDSSYQ